MTNYNLAEFKTWLNKKPENKENLQHWEEFFTLLYWDLQINRENMDNYQSFLQKIKASGEENIRRYLKVMDKYKQERERERERERDEQQNNMVNAQEWLNKEYKNNREITNTIYNEGVLFLEGNLIISDFPNVEEIELSKYSDDANNIPCLEIKNCPKLEKVYLRNCNISELVIENCPNITILDLGSNQLTELNTNHLNDLKFLGIGGNPDLKEIDISHNLKLRNLSCDTGVQPIHTLIQKIQTKERELSSVKEKENQTKITNLEQELQSLKDLKIKLEIQTQQRENELTTELNQLKQQKENLETEIKELHNKDFQKSKDLENQQEEIKQLKSKITLLEQQKTTYQEKFNNSLQFIKDVRKELAEGEEWRPTQ